MDRAHMTIANAVQNGRMVFVYGESGRFLFSQTGELHDYACAHVTIRKGSVLYFYDPHGRCLGSTPVRAP
jgi:hypothetical protein